MQRFQHILSIAVALTLTALPARADQAASHITGTVRSEDGTAVIGATVVGSGAADVSAITDQNGGYRLLASAGARYELRAEAIGYRADSRVVVVGSGETIVDFVLAVAPVSLSPLRVVAATRSGTSAASLPVKVEIIERAEVGLQQGLSSSPTEVLANLIPSFSPARQKLSTAGESFRGRRPLFLIDGVPQSNPLRDGRRDGFTIDMEAIERVEVVFGANAIQGLGATGGIINYVTARPTESGRWEQRASVRTNAGDDFAGDGIGWRSHYMGGRDFGALDLLVSGSYEERGLQYDALNRAIGVDNVQGDIADSHSRNFLAKVGWDLAPEQRLQIMANDFRLDQEGDFDIVTGDRVAGIPTTSVAGTPEGIAPVNDVTTMSLDYEHSAILGGSFSAKAYFQDFAALFGGGRFGTFQDPAIAPEGELFDQSENNSEKYGARLTHVHPTLGGAPLDAIIGFDFLRDKTFQRLVQTNRNWVPATRFLNYAPFAQFDVTASELITVSGGFRWERAALDVEDFTTLAGNRSDRMPVRVTGGSPSFNEGLLNIGGVVTPASGVRFYGTFSQAFTMPDVGRVLRGISDEGTAVEDFLTLEPIKTDNVEVGASWGTAMSLVGLTYFESASDFGSRLVPNDDGIFQVRREPTKTSGWEATSRLEATEWLGLGAAYSMLNGKFDGDGDGTLKADLSAADIGPDRLNLSADWRPSSTVRGRLQSFSFFSRDFRAEDGGVGAEFDGYTTVDASLSAALGVTTLSLSISNLLDEQYITYFGQAGTTLEDRYFAGRGRTFGLGVEARF